MILAARRITSIGKHGTRSGRFYSDDLIRPLVLQTVFFVCVLFSLPHLAYSDILPSTVDMPDTIQVRGKKVALKNLENPLSKDPANLSRHIREGGEVYFKNCFLCHGDLMDGKGLFSDRFFPPPAGFTHSASVVTLPESYAYWRIMKGGPGLPDKFFSLGFIHARLGRATQRGRNLESNPFYI